jgi:PAS domain S-box-containing protein
VDCDRAIVPLMVKFTGVAERISQSEVTQGVETAATTESGKLARVFNRLTATLLEVRGKPKWHGTMLEEEVARCKQTERKLWGLLESVPDAMVIINQDGEITLVNAQTERLFGYPREALLGQPIEMLIPKRFRGNHIGHRAGYCVAPHVRLLDAGLELCGLRRDGSEFPAEISLSPIQTTDGLWVTSIIRDISERKQVEEALRRAHGYDVIAGYDAVLAATMAVKHRPDLILLDITMPGGDGFLVAERLRNLDETARIPIIFLTASKQPGLREKAMELSPAGFFEKPYEAEELLGAIEAALEAPVNM